MEALTYCMYRQYGMVQEVAEELLLRTASMEWFGTIHTATESFQCVISLEAIVEVPCSSPIRHAPTIVQYIANRPLM